MSLGSDKDPVGNAPRPYAKAERMPTANDMQVGGNHYRKSQGEQHWDRAWRLKYDPFQYIITKWIERWRDKGGVEDLKKARHAIDKYIEVAEAEMKAKRIPDLITTGAQMAANPAEPGRRYVDQDGVRPGHE